MVKRKVMRVKKEPIIIGAPDIYNYQCARCGFTYDPRVGLPDKSVKAGTPFDELKQGWKCPGCSGPKEKFRKIAEPLEEAINILGKYYEGAPKRLFEHED